MGNRFLSSAGFYGSASLYTAVLGLVSFPIMTRLFEVAEYGLLGLVSATIPVLVGIGKLGLQHASIRFYSELNAGGSHWRLPQYYSTLFLSMALCALLLWLLMQGFLELFSAHFIEDRELRVLFSIATYLIVTRVLESGMLNLLKAREQAFSHSLYLMVKRTLVLLVTIGVMLLVEVDLALYFLTLTAVEMVLLAVFSVFHVPLTRLRPRYFSKPLLSAMLLFGIPMFGIEFSTTLITITDRYIINAILGAEALGWYTSAFTLVEYAQGIVTMALATAALPIFLRLYAEEGDQAAHGFIDDALRLYYVAAIPVVLIVASAGEAIITLLAGEKYAAGAAVMPWVAAGVGMHGAFVLVACGLYLKKKTGQMFAILAFTAVSNLLLNLWAVPNYGIVGAAVASLVCYTVCSMVAYLLSRRHFALRLPWLSIARAAGAALLTYIVLEQYTPPLLFLELVYKGLVGGILYLALMCGFDSELRQRLLKLFMALPSH